MQNVGLWGGSTCISIYMYLYICIYVKSVLRVKYKYNYEIQALFRLVVVAKLYIL